MRALMLFLVFVCTSLTAQEIMPLAVGNSWTYSQQEFIGDSLVLQDTIVNSVTDTVHYNGNKWYALKEYGWEFLVRNTPKGQYEIDSLSTDDNGFFEEVLMFTYPRDTTPYKPYDEIVFVDPNTTTISTSLGEFDCYKYTLVNEGLLIHFFFREGIGVVRHVWQEEGEPTYICTLIAYHLE